MPDWLTARPVAHRGLHDAGSGVIENTASAFAAAVAGNYAIECDVQISADGEAMVHHDPALGRLTEGEQRLDILPAAALKRVTFKATADRMLSLGELLDLIAGRSALFVEIKSRFDSDMRLARRVADVLASYSGPAAAMSFDPAVVAEIRRQAPARCRGLVAQRRQRPRTSEDTGVSVIDVAAQAVAARPNFLAYRVQDLHTFVPQAARRMLGLPLLTWTVRTPEDRAWAARYADQIIFEGFRP
jgi:glycerophosphoryl diester phosphodiesterase